MVGLAQRQTAEESAGQRVVRLREAPVSHTYRGLTATQARAGPCLPSASLRLWPKPRRRPSAPHWRDPSNSPITGRRAASSRPIRGVVKESWICFSDPLARSTVEAVEIHSQSRWIRATERSEAGRSGRPRSAAGSPVLAVLVARPRLAERSADCWTRDQLRPLRLIHGGASAHVWPPAHARPTDARPTDARPRHRPRPAPQPQLLPAGHDDGHTSPGLAMHPLGLR